MEVLAYVFKVNEFVSFPHHEGFPEWSFITLRLHNDTVWGAQRDHRWESRAYPWKAMERAWGKGERDFVLKGVIRRSWVTGRTLTHSFVDHKTLGLVKIPHWAWEGKEKQRFEVGRMAPEVFNGVECHFCVEKALDKYESEFESDSDDSESSFEAPVWVPLYIRRQNERARRQRGN
ncbi:unnamed protein product [Caenorhabditis brenneri]